MKYKTYLRLLDAGLRFVIFYNAIALPCTVLMVQGCDASSPESQISIGAADEGDVEEAVESSDACLSDDDKALVRMQCADGYIDIDMSQCVDQVIAFFEKNTVIPVAHNPADNTYSLYISPERVSATLTIKFSHDRRWLNASYIVKRQNIPVSEWNIDWNPERSRKKGVAVYRSERSERVKCLDALGKAERTSATYWLYHIYTLCRPRQA